ncbi:D-alanyl-D-alanine carboxypeptidase [Streptomyces sp. NPDC008001]|uniref:D-alanyl-D-alanine carboxypeptidase n=1 Tax=Streptomyces sp. NPDC008001 TaxID=3364804 RepID=UPI0036E751C2
MAGESPGKSEQRKSSGETTRGEHDPRLGVFRETNGKPSGKADAPESADAADAAEGGREEVSAAPGEADAIAKAAPDGNADGEGNGDGDGKGESKGPGRVPGGDARLKAAVAAWVAGTDEDEEPGESGASGDAGEDAASGKDGSKAVPADRATAVFRTVKPKAGAPSGDGGKEAGSGSTAKPASANRPVNGSSSGNGNGSSNGSSSGNGSGKAPVSGEDAASGKDGDKAVPADRATAVFRTVKPKADAPSGDAGEDAGSASGSASGSGKDKPSAPVDQATAVFGAIRPKAGSPAGDAKDKGDAEDAAKGKPSADDQPTALMKAPEVPERKAPAKSSAAQGKPSADDQPTALMKAPEVPERKTPAKAPVKAGTTKDSAAKTGTAKPGAPKGEPREDSDSERTSQFVPLKSLDGAAAPAAPGKPGAKPAAKAAAPAAPPAPAAKAPAPAPAPAKPAIPVSVAPPKPQAPGPGGAAGQPAAEPAAPLDLLAQLTNTPPPPETPVRTVLRRVKIWTPLVVLLAIVFCVVQAFRPLPEPKLVLTANKAFKFDGDKAQMTWPTSGQAYVEVDGLGSLGEYGEEKPVPIASVTKVMTAYITLRDHPMQKGDKKGALMTVDSKAVSDYQKGKPEGESLVRVTEGQKLSEYEALEALMLPSANNIAKLLARWDAGSEEAFVKKMNDTAKDLGMVNTTFTDPSGFDATTKSTAKDLVKLGKKAMADPVFKEISGLTEYIDSNNEKQKNFNPIVPLYGIGIKTGTTTAAGGNLLFAAEKKIGGTTQLIIGAVVAQHKTPIIDSVVAATKDAIESAKKALEAKTVVKKGDVVGAVDDGLGGRTPVVATKDVTAVGWSGLTVGLALNDGGHKLPHTAKPGAEVGMLTVGSGPGQVRVPVALKSALAEPGFGSKLTRLG